MQVESKQSQWTAFRQNQTLSIYKERVLCNPQPDDEEVGRAEV
ncbi:hypothetical protein YSA_04996 [Pseudomonas putida ND6]|uniref:Uncharacterized protein n=1 Tax=Pseudomonas putida ND6 TaxID=231023 RepID=I3UVE8_PSEPU|nr:hypothetical protein YSA_04996 [Pseudomonas putida ND6]